MEKKCGVIMPVFSLPTKYAIGSLGKRAYDFVDFLSKSSQTYWQFLPLVQTGYADSPYQSCCSYSGNPYFIDVEILCEKRLLTHREIMTAIDKGEKIDYGKLYVDRYALLKKAYSRFDTAGKDFIAFLRKGKFNDYALYMTLKTKYQKPWYEWQKEYKFRDENALKKLKKTDREEYLFWQWLQFEFWNEWKQLKKYANSKGIKFIGDLCLYMAYDSCDVWKNPQNFILDENLTPTKIAGVPPDYFSVTGQLWGNPVYNYENMAKDGYSWWKNRIKDALSVYDKVRVDHFRGFDRFWTVPYGANDAINGKWENAPGREIFAEFNDGDIIAEDLGFIDDGVKDLLKCTGYPGMKVVLFSFDGGDSNTYLPWNIEENSITYTGTHDNDTVVGYLKSLDGERFAHVKERVQKCLDYYKINKHLSGVESMWDAIMDIAYASNSYITVVPIQDVLGLDNKYRINTPGSTGCWTMRIKESVFTQTLSTAMKRRAKRFNRD